MLLAKEKYKKLSKKQLGSYSKSVRRTPNQPYHFFQDLISSYSLVLYQDYTFSQISIYIFTTYWLDRVILLARRKYMLITCECERAYYCKQVLNAIQNMTAKEKETCTYTYYFTVFNVYINKGHWSLFFSFFLFLFFFARGEGGD